MQSSIFSQHRSSSSHLGCPPPSNSPFAKKYQEYGWYLVPAIGLGSMLWGVLWWGGIKGLEWSRRRTLRVRRTPFIQSDGQGGYVQKAELVEHEWETETKGDYESGHS